MRSRRRLRLRLLITPLLWNEFLGVLACAAISIGCAVLVFVEDNPPVGLVLVPFGCVLVANQFSRRFLKRLMTWDPK